MPTGPGDEILDAIEAGTADNVVMKKYGVDADQLKAFKSLHYGLSNQKMAYDEIEDYYPEITKYFKLGPYLPKQKAAQPVMEKPDFTKPVKEKAVSESTAQPAKVKLTQQLAESKTTGTLQEKFNKKIVESDQKLHDELRGNDDVVEHMIRDQRYKQAEQQGYNDLAAAPRTDMPAANMLAGMRGRVLEPETKPQDLPVAPEELQQLKSEIEANEPQARQFVNQVVVRKPEKAKELQSSLYMLDANKRMEANPEIGLKVNDNLQQLESGELKYNAQTGQLIKELGFWPSLVSGIKERTRQLENYKMLDLPKDQVIKIMEDRRSKYDPDDPIEAPKGAGEIGQMTGMEWAALLKGTITGIATHAAGAEGAAPYISAAINAPEYYKRGYSSAFDETYNQLRSEGKAPEEAYEMALQQASTEGKLSAAEGAISSFVGGRIGMKELPKFNITGSFKNAVKDVITKTGHFAAETGVEGLADGIVAGYLQDKKNDAAREHGIFRSADHEILENIKGEITFAFAAGAMTQAGKKLTDPNIYKKIVYWMGRQPQETVDAKLGDMVMHGEISDEDAKEVQEQLKEQRQVDKTVPDDIKDVSRMAMLDKIKERDELDEKKKSRDKALQPEIQEQIDKLNHEILEHSKHKIETDLSREEKIAKRDAYEEEKKNSDKAAQPFIQEWIDKLNDEIHNDDVVQTKAENKKSEIITTSADEGAADITTGTGEAAPAGAAVTGELHYTNPEGTDYVLRGEDLYHISKSGKETKFADAAMQTPETKALVQTIKQANQQTTSTIGNQAIDIMEESQGAGTKKKPSTLNATPKQQEFYSSNAGAAPANTGRVMPDPIVGGEPKELPKIIGDVSKGLKQRLIYAKPGRGGAGAYLPGFKGIKIRNNNDLDVTAHELGHAIDDHFDLYTKIAADPQALQELDQFASHGSEPPSGHPNPRKYIDKEGFAEWLRAFVVSPGEAERLAPKVTALYKASTSTKFQEAIQQFSNDVRTFAGANGGLMVMANIEFDPSKPKGLLGGLFKKELTNNNFAVDWVDKLAANFTNPLQAFEKAFKYAKGIRGLSEVLPENDPIILSRIMLGIDGKFGEILKSGMIDGRGNVLRAEGGTMLYDQKGRLIKESGTVKNLQWLLEPFDNTDMTSIKQDMKDTIAFMVAERTVELAGKFERADQITGIGGGIYPDFSVAQKALNEFYNGDPKRLSRIQEAAERYRSLADDILKYAVDKGRLSQEQYEAIADNNLYYVALNRILETEPDEVLTVFEGRGGALGSKSDFIHSIKGSTKSIENPYASLLDILYKTIRESDRNETLRAFRDILVDPRFSNEGDSKRLSDIGMIAAEGDLETIPIFDKGKLERWKFQKDVHEQLKGLDKEAYRLPGLISAPAKTLRFFTTHFPTFAVRNWIRDTQDRIIKSTTGSGFKDLIGSKEDWNAIARAGGLNSGLYLKSKEHYYGLLTEAMDVMAKDKKFILADPVMLKHAWNKYTDLLYKSETSNRVAEYRSAMRDAKAKGMDDYNAAMYAAYKARNLIDFAIMGNWMKIANQIIPFSNAAVQGLRSAAYSLKNDPEAFLDKTILFSIIPGIAAWFWNHRNEEDEKLYEEQPAYQRDMFWNFRVGPNKWLSIPKPYELALPQAGIDRLLSYKYANNKKAFDGYGADIRKLLLPFDEGNIAGPYQTIIEGMANYDFFRERNIIPVDEDPLNLALRHTETASRFGQLLQKYTSIDGRKWDHFLQRQFSYTGSFTLKLSDIGKEDSRHKFDLTDTGLFKRSPAYNSVSVQKMISYAKEFGLTKTPAYKSFNGMVGEYFAATDDEQQEQIGKQLIDYGKELLTDWKANNMDERKIEQAEAKKAAQKK